MAPRLVKEAKKTEEARKKIIELLQRYQYEILEEVELDSVTYNMGEKIEPCYQADIIAAKIFLVELDPESSKKGKSKGHGTKIKKSKDSWRDKNIYSQIGLKTIRVNPDDVLKYDDSLLIDDMIFQLKNQPKED